MFYRYQSLHASLIHIVLQEYFISGFKIKLPVSRPRLTRTVLIFDEKAELEAEVKRPTLVLPTRGIIGSEWKRARFTALPAMS